MAFVNGADERSTFCQIELGEIMNNPNITHINNIKKASDNDETSINSRCRCSR